MMRKLAVLLTIFALAIPFTASADRKLHAPMDGYQETPQTLSTTGNGLFSARISNDGSQIAWTLSYADLEGNVTQAHIHFGQRALSGGISVFLCTNLNNGPAGTQPCPAPPATISGVIDATDVIGPGGQGIEAGALAELVAAIKAGVTYANLHTSKWPSGEIRGQIDHDHGKGND